MDISFEYYKVFYYVARYGTINKAAKILNNSQPNISRIISNLENYLGCKLFVRNNKGVTLTESGNALYYYVKSAFNRIESGETIIKNINSNVKKSLSIGISVGIPNVSFISLIRPSISRFHMDNPNVNLKIDVDSSPNILRKMHSGAIDISLVSSSVFDNKDRYDMDIIYRYRDVIIAGNDYRKILKGRVSLVDIAKHPIIGLGRHTELYEMYEKWFGDRGLKFNIAIETATTEQTVAFVIDNLGIGCVPAEYAEMSIRNGELFAVKLEEKLPDRYISLVKREKSGDGYASVLREYLLNPDS